MTTIAGEQPDLDRQRLPWSATAAALVAFAALYFSGKGYFGLIAMAAALVGSHLTGWRLPGNKVLAWAGRVVLFTVIILTSGERRARLGTSILFEPDYVHLFGYLCAAELVLRAWVWRKGGPSGLEVTMLSALVLTAATNTYERDPLRWLAPAYILLLVLSLRAFGRREMGNVEARGGAATVAGRAVAWGAALLVGLVTTLAVHEYGDELTAWSANLIQRSPRVASVGISASPTLAVRFNPQPSPQRVLKLEGLSGDAHLRGFSSDVYDNGAWGPTLTARSFTQADAARLAEPVEGEARAGRHVKFRRFGDSYGLLYLPLGAAAVWPVDVLEWEESSGVLRSGEEVPGAWTYEAAVRLGALDQGSIARAPTEAERRRLLAVPESIEPGVRELGQRVTAGREGLKAIAAVGAHLRANHKYSLSFAPSSGRDPVSEFLLEGRDAHCQYFASSAVMLLRAGGIPARYVTGYYAHEPAGPRSMVVRQQDAHAWAEAWVEGVGWVTVDATPAGGRPDALFEKASTARKGWEAVQDAWTAVKEWLQSLTILQLSGGMLAVLAIMLMMQLWRARRGVRRVRVADGRYDTPAEMAALAREFERVLRRMGIEVGRTRTWREAIASAGGEHRAGLAEFVERYDAARFGAGGVEQVEQLRRSLRALREKKAKGS